METRLFDASPIFDTKVNGILSYMISLNKYTVAALMLSLVLVILVVFVFARGLRKDLQVTDYTLRFENLPSSFDGLRIAQISDLHGCTVDDLIESVQSFSPDLIFCTGDVFDGVQHADVTMDILEHCQNIAPVYFVSGNHEYYSGHWKDRFEELERLGFHMMDNRVETISRNGQTIEIAGLRDPDLNWTWSASRRLKVLKEDLKTLPEKQNFRLMLFHRADLFEELSPANPDAVFSGHLHGGHWRLFNHGVIAPSDGDHSQLFPKYDAGVFEHDGMKLIVSRGLGDQMSVPRLFNRPELVLVTLHTD